MGTVILKDNPEVRTVLLDWILKHEAFIGKSELASLPKSLIS